MILPPIIIINTNKTSGQSSKFASYFAAITLILFLGIIFLFSILSFFNLMP